MKQITNHSYQKKTLTAKYFLISFLFKVVSPALWTCTFNQSIFKKDIDIKVPESKHKTPAQHQPD